MPYADVNGLRLYYQEHGEGPPLVLLHGGLMTIELNFGIALPVLAERHRVIAVELQGHGRTADVSRPPTFPNFAADVVGLLEHLGIERADVVGFSVGGLTAYELAISYPDRLRRAVLASADHRNDRGGGPTRPGSRRRTTSKRSARPMSRRHPIRMHSTPSPRRRAVSCNRSLAGPTTRYEASSSRY